MGEDIKNTAFKLFNKYRTKDPYTLASHLNIYIHELPFEGDLGMYTFIQKKKVIILSDTLDEFQKRFVLAHELGHAILHPRCNSYFLRKHTNAKTFFYEKEANTFAAELIISDDELKDVLEYGYTIPQIASYFCVPEDLVKLKLDNLH